MFSSVSNRYNFTILILNAIFGVIIVPWKEKESLGKAFYILALHLVYYILISLFHTMQK